MSYPDTFDDTFSLLVAVNNKATTLTNAITEAQTSFDVTNVTGWPQSGVASIDYEVIYYGGIDGNTLQDVLRGHDGTNGTTHAAGAKVEQRWVATFHNTLATSIIELQQTLGLLPAGDYGTVATAITNSQPVQIPMSGSDWSFSYSPDKDHPVLIQLYELISGTSYQKFNAEITQDIGSGEVTIILPESKTGFVIYN